MIKVPLILFLVVSISCSKKTSRGAALRDKEQIVQVLDPLKEVLGGNFVDSFSQVDDSTLFTRVGYTKATTRPSKSEFSSLSDSLKDSLEKSGSLSMFGSWFNFSGNDSSVSGIIELFISEDLKHATLDLGELSKKGGQSRDMKNTFLLKSALRKNQKIYLISIIIDTTSGMFTVNCSLQNS